MNLLSRITINPEVMKGKPTIRDMRFSVAQMLELLAGGDLASAAEDGFPIEYLNFRCFAVKPRWPRRGR